MNVRGWPRGLWGGIEEGRELEVQVVVVAWRGRRWTLH